MGAALYVLVHSAAGIFKNKSVIFKIIPGPEGIIQSGKKTISFRDIKRIVIKQRWHIFFDDLVIYTHQNKVVRMRTYNLIDISRLNDLIRVNILPYTVSEHQEVFKRKNES
ncbi:hypothetical protein GKZ89_09850 [Bacillus mangrovi]|uniref:DUF304 domain-containing protein n=2 Tax=Metabacillus mangrovi TaxID=1491830 RepID=A0A7X2S6K3_9BACI|nr:hypothetical protein [Metabacillus mangrovi]